MDSILWVEAMNKLGGMEMFMLAKYIEECTKGTKIDQPTPISSKRYRKKQSQ